jgi:hypothetical protein
MPRFALLEHTGAPDDPTGRHHDLLLESGAACRTWRLMALPQPGGSAVAALELPAHRLAWLEIDEGEVSGGRGHVRRVDAGDYRPVALDSDSVETATSLVILLHGRTFGGRLRIEALADGWAVSLAVGASV